MDNIKLLYNTYIKVFNKTPLVQKSIDNQVFSVPWSAPINELAVILPKI